MAQYEVDADPARIDMDVVWSYLHVEAYWGRGRSRANVEEQVRGAWRVVGAYAEDGAQVGFARAVSDGVAFAYLADVFVLKDHRRSGLGRRIVHTMIDEGPGAEFRWLLHTGDATFLYASFGFRLALVGAALAKLVLFDLASLNGIPRVLAFLVAGLVLLAAGSRYARLVAARAPPASYL